MEFRTIVNLPNQQLQLTPHSKVLLIGSCFTDYIGQLMTEALPIAQVEVNPNGILYNPGSIFTALQILLKKQFQIQEDSFFKGHDELWHNWLYSGEFVGNTIEECWNAIQSRHAKAQALFRQADALCVTLSTDRGYYLQTDCNRKSLVANCHKEPSRLFTEATIPFATIVKEGNQLLQQLRDENPNLTVVFTLSPYRYSKYGLHESQVSKARLLHAIDELCASNQNALYFPAYEIIMDELRDYRFYKADMIHPSEQAVEYIWERFQEWAFSPELMTFSHEKAALIRDFAHKPLHPESKAAQLFIQQREQKKEKFIQKWGML